MESKAVQCFISCYSFVAGVEEEAEFSDIIAGGVACPISRLLSSLISLSIYSLRLLSWTGVLCNRCTTKKTKSGQRNMTCTTGLHPSNFSSAY
mmetsp:Transcript_22535/g.32452  ORF Transcript_22535/g.32452 Transcript_22535/m.32452 type:complete len:93 (+) Transcript_22535:918-1196(+)